MSMMWNDNHEKVWGVINKELENVCRHWVDTEYEEYSRIRTGRKD